MRTAILLITGFALLGLLQMAAGFIGGKARAALLFLGVWLVATLANLYVGTTHGYTVMQEAPIFLLLFGLPAAAALWLMRKHG